LLSYSRIYKWPKNGITFFFFSLFLSESTYAAIRNVNSLKDLKAVLLDTDYTDWITAFNEQDTTSLKFCLKKKLAEEIDYIQMVASDDLQKFIQMIRHKYMIDNVINIIEGCKK